MLNAKFKHVKCCLRKKMHARVLGAIFPIEYLGELSRDLYYYFLICISFKDCYILKRLLILTCCFMTYFSRNRQSKVFPFYVNSHVVFCELYMIYCIILLPSATMLEFLNSTPVCTNSANILPNR